jgi:DNA segregation ATPase FtsK/SpoIIIE, S-DNA-T family
LAKKRKKNVNREMRQQVKGILLLAFSLFTMLCLFQPEQTGSIGVFTNLLLRHLAGDAAIALSIITAVFALRLLLPQGKFQLKNRLLGFLLLNILVITWIHTNLLSLSSPFSSAANLFRTSIALGLAREGGGLIGSIFSGVLLFLLGNRGSLIILGALALIAILLVLNLSVRKVLEKIASLLRNLIKGIKYLLLWLLSLLGRLGLFLKNMFRNNSMPRRISATVTEKDDIVIPVNNVVETKETAEPFNNLLNNQDPKPEYNTSVLQAEKHFLDKPSTTSSKEIDPDKRNKHHSEYQCPKLDLLSLPSTNGDQNQRQSRERAKKLEETLLSFGVKAKVVHVQSGPTVTRFEVQPEAGVKVSKFVSLSDDLALNLAAPLVRIEAPIPGKAALGIEVPNSSIALVHLREVIEDLSFVNSKSPLTIGLGKDITGIPVIADLTTMPHLLIAGATGAGKSVCLNTIITSIIYKSNPDQVRFLMIDPKVVELSVYNGIPQLLMPVLTDPRKSALALRNMVREMGRRYDLFAKLGIRDINAYNELTLEDDELEKMPYLVVVIDELADLMLVSPGEVEDSIARLAQMSRAAGIHLLVATQRPSVDVLTGIIKANITSRIAFTVSSQFDSRTILDMAGAEKLLGRGDMLFYPVGSVKPFRVQGAYVSEVEVKKVTDFIKEQGIVDYGQQQAILEVEADDVDKDDSDALFPDAVDLVVRTGQASISLLQRRFRIGYTRAARLIDDLERKNIVGPFEGSKPREVLITEEEAIKICSDFKPDYFGESR